MSTLRILLILLFSISMKIHGVLSKLMSFMVMTEEVVAKLIFPSSEDAPRPPPPPLVVNGGL